MSIIMRCSAKKGYKGSRDDLMEVMQGQENKVVSWGHMGLVAGKEPSDPLMGARYLSKTIRGRIFTFIVSLISIMTPSQSSQ